MSRIVAFALILSLILTGCGSKAGSAGGAAGTPAFVQGSNNLPRVTQLIVGTFKLENTANAVTAQQAKELLPLWKAYRSLSRDSASAPAELEALVKQIEETMTAEQLKAIADMNLTGEAVVTVMRDLGLSMPQQAGTTGSNEQSNQGQQPPVGDMVPIPGGERIIVGGGAPPAGVRPSTSDRGMAFGGGVPGGANTQLNPALRQTRQAQRASASVGSSPLLDALIKLLQSKQA